MASPKILPTFEREHMLHRTYSIAAATVVRVVPVLSISQISLEISGLICEGKYKATDHYQVRYAKTNMRFTPSAMFSASKFFECYQ